jgi:hypothetical protein
MSARHQAVSQHAGPTLAHRRFLTEAWIVRGVLRVGLAMGLVASVAQQSSNALRWIESAPDATIEIQNDVRIEGLKTDSVSVFVNLVEVGETRYNRVWVKIFNRGKAPISFDPQSATLVQGNKTLSAEVPEKASNSVQALGEAASQSSALLRCIPNSTSGRCEVTDIEGHSTQVLMFAKKQAQWIRDNGLKQMTLVPGAQAQGAIFFRKGKKSAAYVFRLPLGHQVFEFPLTAENKAPQFAN